MMFETFRIQRYKEFLNNCAFMSLIMRKAGEDASFYHPRPPWICMMVIQELTVLSLLTPTLPHRPRERPCWRKSWDRQPRRSRWRLFQLD